MIKHGLKRRPRKRDLKINAEAKEVFEQLVMESKGRTYSASLVIQTKSSSLGSWNPKWTGCMIKSKPIRMPDFALFAIRF